VFSHAIGEEIMFSCGFPVSVMNTARNQDDPTAGTRVFKKTSNIWMKFRVVRRRKTEAKIKPFS